MRVIAGTARSMPLSTPRGNATRPTADRIKETLFNILQSQIPGAVVADIFAGSGQLGIEALSRGAKYSYFVDNSKDAIKCINDNIAFTKFQDKATVLNMEGISSLGYIHDKCDLIFLDPPYAYKDFELLFQGISRAKCITDDTLIILEADINSDFTYLTNLGFIIEREKLYKTNKHIMFRRMGND